MTNENGNYIWITQKLKIPLSELDMQFSRSGGPGGQNVNRRETRVELLFDVGRSPSLSEAQRSRLLQRLANQIDSSGILHIVAQTYRSQLRNREEALERFVRLLRGALRKRRRRVPTQVPPQVTEWRLTGKRQRSETKRLRKPVEHHEDE